MNPVALLARDMWVRPILRANKPKWRVAGQAKAAPACLFLAFLSAILRNNGNPLDIRPPKNHLTRAFSRTGIIYDDTRRTKT
jgi:hypothetical protein